MDEHIKKCNFALFEFLNNMNEKKRKKIFWEKLFPYTFTLNELETAIFKYAYLKGYNDGIKDEIDTLTELEKRVEKYDSRNNR